ncbi:MAG: hypothetical protein U1A78_40030 [Polyangia bacterium]
MSSPESRLAAAGLAAAQEAERLFALDIIDPKHDDLSEHAERSRALITGFIREGLGWADEKPYQGDGDMAWCGAFAAFCWRAGGASAEVRRKHFASTRRLDKFAAERRADDPCPSRRLALSAAMPPDELLAFGPRPGDLLLIGDADSPHGSHVGLLVGFEPAGRRFLSVEGNGFGPGPSHQRSREGVVRVCRQLDDGTRLVRIVRLGSLDLDTRADEAESP